MDYEETFSPVVKPATVRIILALAVQFNWSLKQLDVSNAFLHGVLQEEVFMSQPLGYVDPDHPELVCKLHKAIYDLKKAPRAWFDSFTSQLYHIGFQASSVDSNLFILHQGSFVVYLLLYVDDIIITGNSVPFIDHLVSRLAAVFDLKDLGPLTYFLGLQIEYTSSGLFVHQSKYALGLLTKFNMLDCKPCLTPCSPTAHVSSQTSPLLPDPTIFRSMVGGLQYLTFTRPDLAYSVQQVCQFMSHPTQHHLVVAKRILRYLKGTLHHGINFQAGSLDLSAYCDADWAGDPLDRKSIIGMVVFLGHSPVTWSAKKQFTVPRSSTEAEYRALATTATELSWLRMILKDLGIFLSLPPMLWCDNVSALALASNPIFHARTKHIEVDYHYIREKVLSKELKVHFISTLDQIADIFTKALSSPCFLDLAHKLMGVPPLNLRGDVKAHATDGTDGRVTNIVHAASGKVADTVGDKAAGKRPIV